MVLLMIYKAYKKKVLTNEEFQDFRLLGTSSPVYSERQKRKKFI